jgi:septum site-determining protein MinC
MSKNAVSPALNTTSANVTRVEHGLMDVAHAENATEALIMLAQALQSGVMDTWHDEIDVNTGYIVLAPAQIRRIAKLLEEAGKPFGVLFSHVPQTQQSALSQGFMVRENPVIRPPRQVIIQETLPFQETPRVERTSSAEAFAQAVLADSEPSLVEQDAPLEAQFEEKCEEQSSLPALEVHAIEVKGLYECEALEQGHFPQEQETGFAETQDVAHRDLPTKIIKGNLRSGRFEQHGGHLVIVGDVHTGAEIRVQGDVIVWGELRGLVHAGFKGSREAEVRALKLDAVQIRIADIMARRPDRHTQLPTAQEPWKAPQGSFYPEIARVVDGEIQLYTTRRHAN